VLLAYSRTWATVVPDRSGVPLPPRELTGAQMWAAGPATGVLLLAGVVAVVAARGHLRTAVGVLLAVAAVGAVVPALVTVADPTAAVAGALSAGVDATSVALTPWWLGAVGAAGLGLLAAVAVVRFGRAWPAMSARYDRARGGAPASGRPADVWDALDRGEDPTREGPADPLPPADPGPPGAAAPGRPG
jgi:uncharacterized membrane protein (TIGR02234 family)